MRVCFLSGYLTDRLGQGWNTLKYVKRHDRWEGHQHHYRSPKFLALENANVKRTVSTISGMVHFLPNHCFYSFTLPHSWPRYFV